MDAALELRIRNWLAETAEKRIAALDYINHGDVVPVGTLDILRAGKIMEDILAASAHESITEQNFQAAQSVLGESDVNAHA